MQIQSNAVFELAQEIYDSLSHDFNNAVKKLCSQTNLSSDACESFLIAMCDDFEDEEVLLYIRNLISNSDHV